jgi:hypothetical protein
MTRLNNLLLPHTISASSTIEVSDNRFAGSSNGTHLRQRKDDLSQNKSANFQANKDDIYLTIP